MAILVDPEIAQEPTRVALTSTERAQLTRERRKRGLRNVTVDIFESEICWLVEAGLLPPSDRENACEIGSAIERLLERSARKPN